MVILNFKIGDGNAAFPGCVLAELFQKQEGMVQPIVVTVIHQEETILPIRSPFHGCILIVIKMCYRLCVYLKLTRVHQRFGV